MPLKYKGWRRTRNVEVLERRHEDGTYYTGFWEWLPDNWHIYEGVVALAREAMDVEDREYWSVDALCHILRWQTSIRDRSQTRLKINDHCTSGLARLIMAREPDLEGFFQIRTPPGKEEAVKLDGSGYYDNGEEDDE